jgi:hypothetical protein
MTRFESFKHAPSETRRILRERLSRSLPVPRNGRLQNESENEAFDDESVLCLLQHLKIERNDSVGSAMALYDAACAKHDAQPSFDDLLSDGWIVKAWDRVYVPRDIRLSLMQGTEASMAALLAWLPAMYDRTLSWAGPQADGRVEALADSIVANDPGAGQVASRSPEWVAARLWERRLGGVADSLTQLRTWLDAWSLLGYPIIVPSRAWTKDHSDAFEQAALLVLDEVACFPSWEEFRARSIQQMAHAVSQSPSAYESYIPEVPGTLVGRAQWLRTSVMERPVHWGMEAWNEICGLAILLLEEVSEAENSQAPHKIAARILDLAMRHPDVLTAVLLRVGNEPRLVAEMLMKPETAALACLVISQWNLHTGAWDRELVVRDNEANRNVAFADAVSILGEHVRAGTLPATEVAALLTEMHRRVRPGKDGGHADDEAMLVVLRAELSLQSKNTLLEVFDALLRQQDQLKLGHASFAAALDVLDIGQLGEDVSGETLISAYVASIQSDDYVLSAERISMRGASELYLLSRRIGETERTRFLFPFDIKRRLAEGENEYLVRDNVARALRVHLRILSRAIVGLSGGIPEDLLVALRRTVRASALAHEEKGRVAALAATYEVTPFRGPWDRPLSGDIAAALGHLPEAQATDLLSELLQTDEPAFLAQLARAVAPIYRPAIERRIEELVPEEAGDSRFVAEDFLRIQELLNAGALNAAEAYIGLEASLPEQAKSKYALNYFRYRLQLAFLRGDWDSIARAEAPAGIPPSEKQEAEDAILFYRGTAELSRKQGSAESAEQIFSRLHRSKPTVPAYAQNLVAAQLVRVTEGRAFVALRGDKLKRANEILLEAERIERSFDPQDAGSDAYLSNKALLLLAIGRNEAAEQLLRSMYFAKMTDRVAAYYAVAQARMGRGKDALDTLDRAEARLGVCDILSMTRKFLLSNTSISLPIEVSRGDDPLPRIAQAWSALSRLDPFQQAEVLRGAPEAFVTFITDQVRYAASSVTSLVSMMRSVEIDSCEDDISAIIRELLASRLAFLGWSVSDQSKGGFTEKENPGERDLLIRKDTSELVALEAVVCNRPPTTQWTRAELKSHFQKLFAYSTCKLFFHLTYAYTGTLSEIVAELKTIAMHDAPEGFVFDRARDLNTGDSRPGGFSANYKGDEGQVTVVFLILNLAQGNLRGAAKLAAKNAARAPKRKSPTK